MKHIVNFSGGKDSTAMLLLMIEKGMKIDEIIFCDTGKEFPEMYEHIKQVEKYIKRSITKLKATKTFDFLMFRHKKTKGKNKGQKGYSWPDFKNRWCTSKLKTEIISKHLKKYAGEEIIEYVGIAADETKRIKGKKYPLVEWQMTERECLEYCYKKGFFWNGLYEKFSRVSCWCCPLKSLKELKVIWKEYPNLWKQLENMDKSTYRKFRADYSIKELEEKFTKEEMVC